MFKTAKRMGIKTVAVYSDADRNAKHVKMADEAVYIGPSPSSQSYLRADKIVEACRKTGADAVHPGYGFLAENAEFARECEKAGIKFIGPKSDILDMMGDKLSAKEMALTCNVPTIPGTEKPLSGKEEAEKLVAPLVADAQETPVAKIAEEKKSPLIPEIDDNLSIEEGARIAVVSKCK